MSAICHTSSHCRRDPERLVDANEFVEHEVQRDRRDMIREILAEAVSRSREPPHVHSHREVLPLDIAGADIAPRISVTLSRFVPMQSAGLCRLQPELQLVFHPRRGRSSKFTPSRA